MHTHDQTAALRVIDSGLGLSVQDKGRHGWRRFGVPVSGWMDSAAAECANRLLDNPADAPVLEMLLQGAAFEVLRDTWIAFCGAAIESNVPSWRTHMVSRGEVLRFSRNQSGIWGYLALEAGIAWPRYFRSASYYARGQLGKPVAKGDLIGAAEGMHLHLPAGVSGRIARWSSKRDYTSPPPLLLWPGPQWDLFSESQRDHFIACEWTIGSQSDRVGYRLLGPPVKLPSHEIISEPVRTGSVQVPASGEPIVTMPDGPGVGGYPKIAVLDPESLPWLAQCRPGQKVRFAWVQDEN